MDALIIKACLNGGRGREDNPNVPWTPQEVADEAARAYNAGAAMVHFHGRTPQGSTNYDPAWYAETDRLIRERCDLVLNHTTARQAGVPVESVVRYLMETPQPVDMASLNPAYFIGWRKDPTTGRRQTTITPNSYEDIVATLSACYSRGILPEPTVQDGATLNNVVTLIAEGALRRSDYFLLEPPLGEWGSGRQFTPGTPRNYITLVEQLRSFYPNALLIAHGSGLHTFIIGAMAIAMGDHIRIGFEDSPRLPTNAMPRSNADFVEWAVAVARLHGREPATPSQARALLRLPQGPA